MEAQVTEAGGVLVVYLRGFMNFETTGPFRQACMKRFLHQPLVLDLKGLSFVGSSGLTDFVNVIREFKSSTQAPVKFSGLSLEFRRLFWASELHDAEIYEDAFAAHSAFTQPQSQTPIPLNFEIQGEGFEEDPSN